MNNGNDGGSNGGGGNNDDDDDDDKINNTPRRINIQGKGAASDSDDEKKQKQKQKSSSTAPGARAAASSMSLSGTISTTSSLMNATATTSASTYGNKTKEQMMEEADDIDDDDAVIDLSSELTSIATSKEDDQDAGIKKSNRSSTAAVHRSPGAHHSNNIIQQRGGLQDSAIPQPSPSPSTRSAVEPAPGEQVQLDRTKLQEEDQPPQAKEVDESELEAKYQQRVKDQAVTAEPIVKQTKKETKKRSTPESRMQQRDCVRKQIYTAMAMLILIFIGGLIVGLVTRGTYDGNDSEAESSAIEDRNVITAVPMPTSLSPTQSPTTERFGQLRESIYPLSGESMFEIGTPQYRAFQWLLNEDDYDITSDNITQDTDAGMVERYVVAMLYYSLNGPYWTDQLRFLSNISICEWPNLNQNETGSYTQNEVDCWGETGLVEKIRLGGINASGPLPMELVGLKELSILDFGSSRITGTLPNEFGQLTNMKWFQIRGAVTGTIPPSFLALPELSLFSVFRNSLTGSIPPFGGAMERFDVGSNLLTGTLPDIPVENPLLRCFFDGNLFTGSIPASLFKFEMMDILYLSDNKLNGTLPSEIGEAGDLEELYVDGNQLTGGIPTELGDTTSLSRVSFNRNEITGTLPTELGNLRRLRNFAARNNQLVGTIPTEFARMRALENLNLQSNQLMGLFPPGLEFLESIQEVTINNNTITSGLNESFCALRNLTTRITADCDDVPCPCCTSCCDEESGICENNVFQICRTVAAAFENTDDRGTVCGCSESGERLSCDDTECQSCNLAGDLCIESTEYGYGLDNVTGNLMYFSNTMQYVAGINDTLLFESGEGVEDRCAVSVNGEMCQACSPITCQSNFEGLLVFCNNLGHGDFNSCEEFLVLSPLEALRFLNAGERSGCSPIVEFV